MDCVIPGVVVGGGGVVVGGAKREKSTYVVQLRSVKHQNFNNGLSVNLINVPIPKTDV